jgi:hypothetical protein
MWSTISQSKLMPAILARKNSSRTWSYRQVRSQMRSLSWEVRLILKWRVIRFLNHRVDTSIWQLRSGRSWLMRNMRNQSRIKCQITCPRNHLGHSSAIINFNRSPRLLNSERWSSKLTFKFQPNEFWSSKFSKGTQLMNCSKTWNGCLLHKN